MLCFTRLRVVVLCGAQVLNVVERVSYGVNLDQVPVLVFVYLLVCLRQVHEQQATCECMGTHLDQRCELLNQFAAGCDCLLRVYIISKV